MSYGGDGEVSATLRPEEAIERVTSRATKALLVATGSLTAGRYGLFRWDMHPRAGGPMPHFHRTYSEAFYILDGRGYEIHDGVRYDWKAGDIAIVHMNCVHQHFNADPDKPARALVMKPKPLLIFMNMLFQQTVIPRPKEAATPAGEGYVPRHFETNHNHEE